MFNPHILKHHIPELPKGVKYRRSQSVDDAHSSVAHFDTVVFRDFKDTVFAFLCIISIFLYILLF